MAPVARSLAWPLAMMLSACLCRPAAADYSDQAPIPPPLEAERPDSAGPSAQLDDPSRPAETGPAAAPRAVDPFSPAARPLYRRPLDPRPVEQRPAEPWPESQSAEARPADAGPAEVRPGEIPPADDRYRPVGTAGTGNVNPADINSRPPYAAPPEPVGPDAAPRRLPPTYQATDYQVPVEATASPPGVVTADGPRPLPLARKGFEARSLFRSGEVPPLVAGAASLGIVLSLFLLVTWVARRSMPKGAGFVPREAVEVLGRAPLAGRQQVHLVRCGNKILLVAMTPTGVETLTEITDPDEVDRLAGICQHMSPARATASFRQMFGQLGKSSHGLDYLADSSLDELEFDHTGTLGRQRA
jgi:flagellar biogenesis protein FliO